MDVFVIPLRGEDYVLYCEHKAPVDTADEDGSRGWFSRFRARFDQMVREAESGDELPEQATAGLWERLQTRMIRWVAQRVAEQRLLWSLRRETRVRLVHPDDLGAEQVLALVRRLLQVDYERHRRWFVIDGLLAAITGPLFFFIPGPNLVAYVFTFRFVGHWLSMRGAARGKDVITWTPAPDARLTELRSLLQPGARRRASGVAAVADALGLERLDVFIERVAPR
jgi:hypothetical protein